MSAAREFLRSFHERYCMYRYPLATPPPLAPPLLDGLGWSVLENESIERWFAGQRRHITAFQRFLQLGSLGICINVGQEWATHAWMALPGKPRPPHVAGNVAPEACWIYFCATKYGFGGQGLYKFAQRLLIQAAFECLAAPQILIDTAPDNSISRQAITATGFEPYGMLVGTYIKVPGLMRAPLSCRWDQSAPHPPPL